MGEPVATADPDEPAPPYLEMSGLEDLGPLPEGWSLKWHGVGETRRPYFINHATRQTTWDDPRKNRTPVAPPARTTSSQSRPTGKQRQEPTKTTMSEEEIMAKAIALSMAEAEEKKKKQASMPRPKPTTTPRPTTPEITTNVYDNNTANSTSFGAATLAGESS